MKKIRITRQYDLLGSPAGYVISLVCGAVKKPLIESELFPGALALAREYKRQERAAKVEIEL